MIILSEETFLKSAKILFKKISAMLNFLHSTCMSKISNADMMMPILITINNNYQC